jgi:hypothetical protein
MKASYFTTKDLLYAIPLALLLGGLLASVQSGNRLLGILVFSFLFLVSVLLLKIAHNWSNAGKTLAYITALAFFLRLAVGVTLHLALPLYGHDDEDDRAGYVYTDAHKRDDQAWALATSDHPIVAAFSRSYASDQYGGLLAFNSLIYRYLSPDSQRPLMLVLFSTFFAALGVPFLWKAVQQVFDGRVAWAAAWIFALYPESILLGASAMREPYLLTFGAFALWGFVGGQVGEAGRATSGERLRSGWIWLGIGLAGMLFVSPVAALVTIVIFGGWVFFTREDRQISWKGLLAVAIVFMLSLFLLSASLNRAGEFDAASPLHVINDWMKIAVRMNVYEIERGSGWVQKIFDEGPLWIRLPFIAIYGTAQPVLPATVIHPTKLIWTIIGFLRGLGWYVLIPLLVLSSVAAGWRSRTLILWLSLVVWIWVLLAALRGGADLYDNPRYRTIQSAKQAVYGGEVWVWSGEASNRCFLIVILMEVVIVLVFSQWYAGRDYH